MDRMDKLLFLSPFKFTRWQSPHSASFCLLIVFLFSTLQAFAQPLQLRVANSMLANADYHQGESDKPAVLVLHGFLSTHHFPTVQHIAGELRESGYSVLTPSLTLGLNNRTTSLPCDALHLHNMEQSVEEIDWWVEWLVAKGHTRIHLIGHSAGSLQLLIANMQKHNAAVQSLTLTSLIPLERLPSESPKGDTVEMALKRLKQGDSSIRKYDLSFCHGNFAAPPEVYLSYVSWTKQRIINGLKSSQTPINIIMGGNDKRFTGNNWMPLLLQAAPKLDILEGANHFYDGDAEFALLESILDKLETLDTTTNRGT